MGAEEELKELKEKYIKLKSDYIELNEKYLKNLDVEEENIKLQMELIEVKKLIPGPNQRGAGRKKKIHEVDQVREVKELRAQRLTVKDIAERMNCSTSTINRILRL